MRLWPAADRIAVGIDFGKERVPLGTAAGRGRSIQFQYDDTFIERGLEPSPIRLPLGPQLRTGPPEFSGLPGLLHDSLPDGWSKLVLDRYVRAQGFDPGSLGSLDRLGLVGDDGPGALRYDGASPPIKAPSVDFDTAAALVSGALDEPDADRVLMAMTMARSLGGARPKAYVFLNGSEFSTAQAEGAEPWIVKFDAKGDGPQAGVVEYAYSLMAAAAGIDIPPTSLLPSARTAGYFAIRRFDRSDDGVRLHVQSLGGLLQVTADSSTGYRELMLVTGALTKPHGADIDSIEQQIRRMAFNVLARNRDDHVKNHAFLMDQDGVWSCSPAFDLTFANAQRHALMIGNDKTEPGREDMLDVTRSVDIEDARALDLIGEVGAAISDWHEFARRAGVDTGLAADIGRAMALPKTV